MLNFTIDVPKNGLPGFSAAVAKAAGAIVAKAALDVEGRAKVNAPVDTGNLRNSVAADTSHAADQLTAEVAVGAEYGVYVEMGTVKAAAQPFLTPAAEVVRPGFERAMAQAIEDVAQKA